MASDHGFATKTSHAPSTTHTPRAVCGEGSLGVNGFAHGRDWTPACNSETTSVDTPLDIPGTVPQDHCFERHRPSRTSEMGSMASPLSGRSTPGYRFSRKLSGTSKGSTSRHSRAMNINDAIVSSGYKRRTTSRWVINPDRCRYLGAWDALTFICLLFVAIVTPVEVGMLNIEFNILFIINRAIDVFFLLDMILQFFLMYPVNTRYGQHLEYRHPYIIAHYCRTWFVVDFFSILPLDTVGLFVDSDELRRLKGIKIVRLLRLLKLVRALKASVLFRRIEIGLSVTYQKLNLLKFFMFLIVACHWQACVWAMTLQLVDADEGVPRWIDYITELEENVVLKTKDSPWKLYIASAYFAAYTMTSVGFGDVAPANIVERVVCLFLLFAAGITWAYIIGQVCNVVGTMGVAEQAFRKTMDDLNAMMQDRSVPEATRRRLRRFFLSTKDTQRHTSQRELFAKMSPALQGEVALVTNQIWIEKVTFLRTIIRQIEINDGTQPPFLIEIAMALETFMYAQQEEFGRPHVLYIQSRGLTGRSCRICRAGCVWGEDFVLTDSHLLDPVTSYALTYVEVACLSRTAFYRIITRNKFLFPALATGVRKFCVRLAAQRGILEEARQRRLQKGDKRLEQALSRKYGRFDHFRMIHNHDCAVGTDSGDFAYGDGAKTRRRLLKADDLRHLEAYTYDMDPGQDQVMATTKELHALRQEVYNLRVAQARSSAIIESLAERLLPTEYNDGIEAFVAWPRPRDSP